MKNYMLVAAALSVGFLTLSAIEHFAHTTPDSTKHNINNTFSLGKSGWNTIVNDINIKDHTIKEITDQNNTTLYVIPLFDLREDTIGLNNLHSSSQGDFNKPKYRF
jgi:hypothetical protein